MRNHNCWASSPFRSVSGCVASILQSKSKGNREDVCCELSFVSFRRCKSFPSSLPVAAENSHLVHVFYLCQLLSPCLCVYFGRSYRIFWFFTWPPSPSSWRCKQNHLCRILPKPIVLCSFEQKQNRSGPVDGGRMEWNVCNHGHKNVITMVLWIRRSGLRIRIEIPAKERPNRKEMQI